MPVLLLLASLEADKLSRKAPLALFAGSLAAYLILNHWYEAWLCPRCGKKFVEARNATGISECAGCGLAKWSDADGHQA